MPVKNNNKKKNCCKENRRLFLSKFFFLIKRLFIIFPLNRHEFPSKQKNPIVWSYGIQSFFFIVFFYASLYGIQYMLKLQPATIVFFFIFPLLLETCIASTTDFHVFLFQFVLSIFRIINGNADSFVKYLYICLTVLFA